VDIAIELAILQRELINKVVAKLARCNLGQAFIGLQTETAQ
jgi:hypothetical protein